MLASRVLSTSRQLTGICVACSSRQPPSRTSEDVSCSSAEENLLCSMLFGQVLQFQCTLFSSTRNMHISIPEDSTCSIYADSQSQATSLHVEWDTNSRRHVEGTQALTRATLQLVEIRSGYSSRLSTRATPPFTATRTNQVAFQPCSQLPAENSRTVRLLQEMLIS